MSQPLRSVVVGGGVAGTAGAWALASGGALVTCVFPAGGASGLASGMLLWGAPRDASGPSATFVDFSLALGLWTLSPNTELVTSTGGIASAFGHDRALLDLAPLAGKRVAIPELSRPGWDAAWLARSINEAVGSRGPVVETREVSGLLDREESLIPDLDLALRLDRLDRAQAFAEALRAASADVDAWLVGPWLGTRRETPSPIAASLGIPIGEVASPPGGAAGLRWENARDALFARLGIQVVSATALSLSVVSPHVFDVVLDGLPALHADRVLVATGGVAGGGIAMVGDAGVERFAPSCELPFELLCGTGTARFGSVERVPDLERAGLSTLERVGVSPEDAARIPGLAVAGDLVFDQPRVVPSAVESGLSAAARLLSAPT